MLKVIFILFQLVTHSLVIFTATMKTIIRQEGYISEITCNFTLVYLFVRSVTNKHNKISRRTPRHPICPLLFKGSYSTLQLPTASYNTSQHPIAPHSTPQHPITPHSTPQHPSLHLELSVIYLPLRRGSKVSPMSRRDQKRQPPSHYFPL